MSALPHQMFDGAATSRAAVADKTKRLSIPFKDGREQLSESSRLAANRLAAAARQSYDSAANQTV
ncbi:MAG: hypothetical protein ABI852_00570 [Gemmatimonadaceae bacterium]